MLDYTKEDLQELGAEITTREIYQQPSVWKETARLYQERKAECIRGHSRHQTHYKGQCEVLYEG